MASRKTSSSSLIPFPSSTEPEANPETEAVPPQDNDKAVLDELEKLAADCILEEDDGDEPGAKDEIQTYPVEKNLPRFANFRSNPATVLEFWGTTDRQGMDDLLYVTTKKLCSGLRRRCRSAPGADLRNLYS
jgi:hypothetical protein